MSRRRSRRQGRREATANTTARPSSRQPATIIHHSEAVQYLPENCPKTAGVVGRVVGGWHALLTLRERRSHILPFSPATHGLTFHQFHLWTLHLCIAVPVAGGTSTEGKGREGQAKAACCRLDGSGPGHGRSRPMAAAAQRQKPSFSKNGGYSISLSVKAQHLHSFLQPLCFTLCA